MKEFIIIAIILIIIIGGDIIVENYLKNTSKDLIKELNELKEEIIANKENVNTKEIKEISEKVYKKWEETENEWAIIVLHSELDLIETSFTKIRSGVATGELNRSLEEIETNLFLIEHISKKEKFCIKNIL